MRNAGMQVKNSFPSTNGKTISCNELTSIATDRGTRTAAARRDRGDGLGVHVLLQVHLHVVVVPEGQKKKHG